MLITPNLFVAGAPKCGTTTLYDYLVQHPEIAMSREKEPAFFDKDRFFDEANNANKVAWEEYLAKFDRYRGDGVLKYIGDATPTMVFPKMPERILRMCGNNVKVVISLRNPVDRAYSHYWHGYRLGLESGRPDQDLFLDEEPEDVCDTGRFPKHYLLTGRYWVHIERFVSAFGRENVLLLNFEELVFDTDLAMNKIWRFLGLDAVHLQRQHSNPAQAPVFPVLQRFVAGDSHLKRWIKLIIPSVLTQKAGAVVASTNLRDHKYPAMDLALRSRLEEYYRQDNCLLAERYGFDISAWEGKVQ